MGSRNIIAGMATAEGTARFASRFEFPVGAFRQSLGLKASSIGFGTYLGEPEDSPAYRASLVEAMREGLNVIDTAINYRHQASERDIGAALAEAVELGIVQRDEVIISTKGGFLPLDYEHLDNPRKYLSDNFLSGGLFSPDEIVGGCQCISPRYIDNVFERSLANMGLEAVDIYFLHNVEMQLEEVSRKEMLKRVKAAFEVLAGKVYEGKLGVYGVATWDGLRRPARSNDALLLEELLRAAIEVEGTDHHFRAVQLPLSLGMTEALRLEHDPRHHPKKTVLDVAGEWDMFVMTSASIMQGQLAKGLPEQVSRLFPRCETDAQRSLQHTRCAPAVTTALVGMKSVEHVTENLALMRIPCMKREYIRKMHGAAR